MSLNTLLASLDDDARDVLASLFDDNVTDEERAALKRVFARLADLDAHYPGTEPPVEYALADDNRCPLADDSFRGAWVSWAFDGRRALTATLLQGRAAAVRTQNGTSSDTRPVERVRLFAALHVAKDASGVAQPPLIVALRTDAVHVVRRADGQLVQRSIALDGHLVVPRRAAASNDDANAPSPPPLTPLFVAWQCLWQAGSSRVTEDTQSRMTRARACVDALAAGTAEPPLAAMRHPHTLDFAYRAHQTPAQARSVLARPLPSSMCEWSVRSDAVELRRTDTASLASPAYVVVASPSASSIEQTRELERVLLRCAHSTAAAATATSDAGQ